MIEFRNLPAKLERKLLENPITIPEGKAFCLAIGVNGSGKSHGVVDAIFRRMQPKNSYTAVYETLRGMIDNISEAISKKQGMVTAMKLYRECDCLVIDEFLATDREVEGASRGYVGDLLCERMAEDRQTILITNRETSELKQKLDPRLVSRMLDDGREETWLIQFKKRNFNPKNVGKSWLDLELEKPGMSEARFILQTISYSAISKADEAVVLLNAPALTQESTEWMLANATPAQRAWLEEKLGALV